MKKRLLAATIAAMMSLTAGVAMATPVELSGSVSLQDRKDTDNGNRNGDGKFTFVLNAKTKIADKLSLYARLGMQNSNKFPDYNTAVNSSGDPVAFDQMGLLYSNAGFDYKLGRQDVTIGATALLYNDNFYVGKRIFSDGVTVTGTSGVTNLKAIVVRKDAEAKDKIYALQGSYSPAKDWTLGATLAKYSPEAGTSTSHWAVNAGYNFSKVSIVGEYAKSNVTTDNKAYDLAATYNFDSKNSVSITNFRVEAAGDMARMTDFFNNEKGFIYGYNHKLNKDTTLGVFYKDSKAIDTDVKRSSLRTTITYSF